MDLVTDTQRRPVHNMIILLNQKYLIIYTNHTQKHCY